MNEEKRIIIVGAGVSGLIAAYQLEQAGYAPLILEASDRPGGRLKTEVVEGYILDRGFQVLNLAYPMLQKHLDLDALNLAHFKPGAAIFRDGNKMKIGDALRAPALLVPTAFSDAATLRDKVLVMKLLFQLRAKSIDDIFAEPLQTTYQYLKNYGFSDRIMERFLRPFFAGIFLEPELVTPSRKFEFVFKMFASGGTAVPKQGIETVTIQLTKRLEKSTVRTNRRVQQVAPGLVTLNDGTQLQSDAIIVATSPDHVGIGKQQDWKTCDTLYFTTTQRVIKSKLIGLLGKDDCLVNNVLYPTNLQQHAPEVNKHLLSVTVVKDHNLNDAALVAQVTQELQQHFKITDLQLLKHLKIEKALPWLNAPLHDMPDEVLRPMDGVYLAGDTTLNASLNAAMRAGETAAAAVVRDLMS